MAPRKRNADTPAINVPDLPEGHESSEVADGDSNPNGENEMTATTAPEFDFASLAAEVEDSPVEKITRTGNSTGRPKEPNPFAEKVAEARADGKVKRGVFPAAAVPKILSYLRRAADDAGHGLKLSTVDNGDGTVTVDYEAKDKKNTGNNVTCPVCGNETLVTADGKIRVHGPRNNRCHASGSALTVSAE